MRIRMAAALSILALGMTLAGGTAAQAAEDTTTTPASPMPGMSDMHDTPGVALGSPAMTTPDKAAGIQRSKLKPVFLGAKLNGANEVQVPGTPPVGDPKGSGIGIIRVQGDKVTFAFFWKGISAPIMGHIHQGAAGANGDVKVPLFTTSMPENVPAAAGSVTVSDAAIADALRTNPDGFYLNLHTKEFPGGAVRGQLTELRHPADVLSQLQGGGEKGLPLR